MELLFSHLMQPVFPGHAAVARICVFAYTPNYIVCGSEVSQVPGASQAKYVVCLSASLRVSLSTKNQRMLYASTVS